MCWSMEPQMGKSVQECNHRVNLRLQFNLPCTTQRDPDGKVIWMQSMQHNYRCVGEGQVVGYWAEGEICKLKHPLPSWKKKKTKTKITMKNTAMWLAHHAPVMKGEDSKGNWKREGEDESIEGNTGGGRVMGEVQTVSAWKKGVYFVIFSHCSTAAQ